MRDIKLKKYVGIVSHPAISIENQTFRGNYQDANNVFKAICSTMEERPDICSEVSIVDPFKPYVFDEHSKELKQEKEAIIKE